MGRKAKDKNGMCVEAGDIIYDKRFGYGVIVKMSLYDCGVRFDKANRTLHNLNGDCDNNHGWYCDYTNIELFRKKGYIDFEEPNPSDLNVLLN